MKYTIIKNSEGPRYDIADDIFTGIKPHLACGWQFELARDGKTDWGSVMFHFGTAEECAAANEEFWTYCCGCTPTGRVVFRGYYSEEYDTEERDWYYVKEAV